LENTQKPDPNPEGIIEETKPRAPATQQTERQPQTAETNKQLDVETSEAEERKRHNLILLEAALYVAGRPLEVNELCSVLTTRSKRRTEQLLETLREEYEARNT